MSYIAEDKMTRALLILFVGAVAAVVFVGWIVWQMVGWVG